MKSFPQAVPAKRARYEAVLFFALVPSWEQRRTTRCAVFSSERQIIWTLLAVELPESTSCTLNLMLCFLQLKINGLSSRNQDHVPRRLYGHFGVDGMSKIRVICR